MIVWESIIRSNSNSKVEDTQLYQPIFGPSVCWSITKLLFRVIPSCPPVHNQPAWLDWDSWASFSPVDQAWHLVINMQQKRKKNWPRRLTYSKRQIYEFRMLFSVASTQFYIPLIWSVCLSKCTCPMQLGWVNAQTAIICPMPPHPIR